MGWNLLARSRGASAPAAPEARWNLRYVPCLLRLEDRLASATVTPFDVRHSVNATGDIAIIANTLETASTVNSPGRTPQAVIDAQNGVGPNTDNNVARTEFKKLWFCAAPRYR